MIVHPKGWSEVKYKCPKCNNNRVYRAHRTGIWDRLLSLLNIYPYRCRQHPCKTRFYRFGRERSNKIKSDYSEL